jgi:hypothetical protein
MHFLVRLFFVSGTIYLFDFRIFKCTFVSFIKNMINRELTKKILVNGSFLGLAFSSGFILNMKTDDSWWITLLYFILIFGIYSATVIWIRDFQQYHPEEKLKLKNVIGYTFKLFLVGSIVASFIKYIYIVYINPNEYALTLEKLRIFFDNYKSEIEEGYKKAIKEKNQDYVIFFRSTLVQFGYMRNFFLSIYSTLVITFIQNILASIILGWIIWPIFKFNQQKPTPLNQ